MVQNPMDAFMTGMQQSQAMFDHMMQNKMRPYQTRLLEAQAKEAEAKAAAMPQQMKMFQQFMGGSDNDTTSQPTGSQTPGAFDQNGNATTYNSVNGTPNASPATGATPQQDQQNISNMKPGDSYVVGSNRAPQNAWAMNKSALVNRANQDQATSDQQNNVAMPNAAPTNQPIAPQAPNAQNSVQSQQGESPSKSPYESGQEVETKAGDPNKAQQDRAAQGGFSASLNGMSLAPKIIRTTVDGVEKSIYPSGRETIRKVAPSYLEKKQMDEEVKGNEASRQADLKSTKDIESSVRNLINAAHTVKQINDTLDKNPKMTGAIYNTPLIGEQLAKSSTNSDLGKFIGATTALQAQYAKAESSRAGIGMVKFFQNAKPDKGNSYAVNKGLIDQNKEKITSEINDAKAEWEAKNPGKKFPFEIPDMGTSSGAGNKVVNGYEYKMINGVLHKRKV